MSKFSNLFLILPVPLLIVIAVIAAALAVLGIVATMASRAAATRAEVERRDAERRERMRRERAAAVKREQEAAARRKKKKLEQRAAALTNARRDREERERAAEKARVDSLGKHGVAFVKRAEASVQRVMSAKAAKTGWLGEVDFTEDTREIEATLRRSRELRAKSDQLLALPHTNADDRRMIAEVKAIVRTLDGKAKQRVELLERCASEAQRIDESLNKEREAAQLAERRAELHGELAAMLYGAEAADSAPADSAADAVLARVQAYRDIKVQIERARGDAESPGDGQDADSWIPPPLRNAWKWVSD